MSTMDDNHDPIRDPRPEDLHAYGIVNALVWFTGIFLVGVGVYYAIGWLFAS